MALTLKDPRPTLTSLCPGGKRSAAYLCKQEALLEIVPEIAS